MFKILIKWKSIFLGISLFLSCYGLFSLQKSEHNGMKSQALLFKVERSKLILDISSESELAKQYAEMAELHNVANQISELSTETICFLSSGDRSKDVVSRNDSGCDLGQKFSKNRLLQKTALDTDKLEKLSESHREKQSLMTSQALNLNYLSTFFLLLFITFDLFDNRMGIK